MPKTTAPQEEFNELSFEYAQLRQEILHNGALNSQTLSTTLAIVGVLMGIAFSLFNQDIQGKLNIAEYLGLMQGMLFLLAALVVLVAILQTLDRERATYVIATYLRLFIEPKLNNLKWETRLKDFRVRSHTNTGYGNFITLQTLIYFIIVLVNFLLGLNSLSFLPFGVDIKFLGQILLIGLICLIVFYGGISLYRTNEFSQKHDEIYIEPWNKVLREENKDKKDSGD